VQKLDRDEYLKAFPIEKVKCAHALALDIRKFEIDLYWKRAVYFWAFIAAAFAGYFTVQKSASHDQIPFVVACLGFLFSVAWYFVNRGSKAWQQNWELHVDLLEDGMVGPLYKTILQNKEKYHFVNLVGAYWFSPSKLNQLLSLFIVVIWSILGYREFMRAYDPDFVHSWLLWAMLIATFIFVILLFFAGQSGQSGRHDQAISIFKSDRKAM
jgi:hypothetical protein